MYVSVSIKWCPEDSSGKAFLKVRLLTLSEVMYREVALEETKPLRKRILL